MRPTAALKLAALSSLFAMCNMATAATVAINPTTATVNTTGGATTPASLAVQYTGDATVVGYQTDITFDNTQMSVALANGNADSCIMFSPTTVRIQDVDAGLNPLPSGVACTLTFTVNAGQTAGTNYPVNVNNTLCSNNTGMPAACTETDGTISVVAGPQPTFTGAPPPGPLVINTFVGDSSTNKTTVNVTNTGAVGSTLQVTASMATGTLVTVSPTAQQNIAQGAAAVPFTVTCDTTAVGTNNDTLSFATNEASGSPHTYAVTCNVAAAPAPVYSSNPVPTTPINISAPVGGSNTATIVVTNTGNAPLNVGAASGLSGVLSIAPTTAQNGIAPAGTVTYTITCSPTSVGTVGPQTLTLGPTNEAGAPSYTYPVSCTGSNPAFSSAPAPGSTITINTTPNVAATSNLTVTNTGSVGSTLVVNAPAGLSAPITIAPNTSQNIARVVRA